MKYAVRLKDWNGNIIDGEVFDCENEMRALSLYIERCKRLGIKKSKYDDYTVEEWIYD